MIILNRRQSQQGVGLIEVLVALVVIAVGVIAILGLQGTLMSGSSTTKARNEAVVLARGKTEELRNAVELGQFDTELAVQGMTEDPDGKIDGVNAQFTRSWSIADVDVGGDIDTATNTDSLKELVMQVTWEDARGEDNQVTLNTLVAYASPLTSALSGPADGPVSPGGTDTGYEGLHGETPTTGGADNRADDEIKDLEERLGITKILRYSNSGHVQVRIEDPDCPSLESTDTDCTCPMVDRVIGRDHPVDCVVFTAFGGTLLRFGGTVYVDGYTDDILIKGTSPAYCAHQQPATCASVDCMEYLCYASGDCSKRDGNGNGTSTGGGADCPTVTGAELEALNLPDLNGGWYGKIGYYFPEETSANFPAVCMGKYETVDLELADNKIAARSYYSERTDASSYKWREGINQPYSDHNTLIGRSKTYDCDAGYEKMVTAGIVWNSFVGPKVIRDVTGVDNTVQDTDTTYSDLVAIYGTVLFPEKGAIIEISPTVTATPAPPDKEPELLGVSAEGGECEVHSGNYACNFIVDQWSGYIIASAEPKPYEVTTTNPDGSKTTETYDFTCEGSLYYAPATPATGRNPGRDLSIICFYSP